MAAWQPTHLVHPEPIDARPQPDPTLASEATLAAGVEVIVSQVVGDWSEVLCHNGWIGWVDGRGLVPLHDRDDGGAGAGADPPPTDGPGLAGAAGAAGVVGAVGVAGVVALTGPDVVTGGPGAGSDVGAALAGAADVGAAGVSSLGGAVHPTDVAGAGVGGAVDATGAAVSSLGAAVHPIGVAGVGGAVGAIGVAGVGGAVDATGVAGAGVGGAVDATGASVSAVGGAVHPAGVSGAGIGGAVQPSEAAGSAVGGAVHPTAAAGVGGAVHTTAAAGSVMGGAVDPGGDTSAERGAAKASRGIGAIVGVLAALLLVLVPLGAAVAQNVDATGPGGADLTGCAGRANSSSAAAGAVGTVSSASGNPSSPSHPFVVDPNGSVSWQGSTDATITDNSWQVKSYGFPVRSGGGANDDQRTALAGQENVQDYLKAPVVGLFQVSGNLEGVGGTCTGSMWVKVDGSPLGTPAWIAAVLLLLGGAGIVWFSRPSTRKVG